MTVSKYFRACTHGISQEEIAELAADKDWSVRLRISYRHDVSADILTILAQDSDGDVQRHVGKNPNTPLWVKLWLTSGYRESMPLKEFLEVSGGET